MENAWAAQTLLKATKSCQKLPTLPILIFACRNMNIPAVQTCFPSQHHFLKAKQLEEWLFTVCQRALDGFCSSVVRSRKRKKSVFLCVPLKTSDVQKREKEVPKIMLESCLW